LRRSLLAIVITVFVLALSAPADADPLTFTAATPADGATLTSSPTALVDFTLTGVTGVAPAGMGPSLWVKVSSSDVPGQDGTLADDYVVDVLPLRADATPGAFRGQARGSIDSWLNRPSAYYWQASVQQAVDCSPPGPCTTRTLMTPIYRVVVSAPAPAAPPAPTVAPERATLSATEVRSAIRIGIRRNAHRSARGLVYRCGREDNARFTCQPNWHDTRYQYRGRMTVWSDTDSIYVRFRGTRATRPCVRRHGAKACARTVRWG